MREIKFRGKTYENQWVYGDLIHFSDDDFRINPQKDHKWDIEEASDIVVPDTVGEFTGLTDKNGKEIWDRDIIEFTTFDYNGVDTQKVGELKFVDGCFGIIFQDFDGENRFYPLFRLTIDDIEVIGNIYENPDLVIKEE